jgi:beta-phosphoglucomutase-like phosphatase (HAD superfamily)
VNEPHGCDARARKHEEPSTAPALIEVAFFDLGQTLVSGSAWIPGAKDTLAQLRARGVRLGIISNTGELSRVEILERLPQDFDLSAFENRLVLFSSLVHVAKPNPQIFRRAVEAAGVPAASCLFCTEEPGHADAAAVQGMTALVVQATPGLSIGGLVQRLVDAGRLAA